MQTIAIPPSGSAPDVAAPFKAPPLPDALSYSFPAASRITGLGRTALYALVKQGRLRKITVAGRSLIDGDSLRALIANADTGNARKPGPGRPRKSLANAA